MDEIFRAIILGIIQGFTEFLPISSSGHLEIAKCIIPQDSTAKESMLMTIVLHFATAMATLFIFRKELFKIFSGIFKKTDKESFWFSMKILLSMIPAVCVGLLWETEIEMLFDGKIILVGSMLLITGCLLFLANQAKPSEKKLSIKDAIWIGIAQAIAILPGISRSGATISTAVLLGIDKESSARFSFLMVVPLIFGKMAKDMLSGEITSTEASFLPLVFGFIFAFFSGLLACKWMIKIVKNSQLKYFAFYCFAIGILTIFLFYNHSFPCQN